MNNHVSGEPQSDEIELIIGNSNSNFSGVTSTMLQVMYYQKEWINLRIMGTHFLPEPALAISFLETAKLCRVPLKNGKWRIFHARRVDEMIQGILLKCLFRAKIKLVFSSAAQRKRSVSTVWLTRKMDAVIAVSKRSAGFLCDPPNLVNPHGVQVNDYLPAKDKQQAWADLGFGGKYGVGILGRVRKQKGVHLLVEACIQLFDKYPDYHCVVVGAISSSNKEFVEQLKIKAAQANMTNRITFTGELPFEQIPTIFSALSLVSALSDNEGFGLTVLEAMSSGAAVLVTEAGAWEEIVRPEVDGYIVPVNDQQAVIEKMDLLLSDIVQLEKMGIEGRKRVEASYRVEDEATRLIEFFRTLQ
ncbi:MAG: mannosyltransferase [Paraglaciecola sp.]|jgi:glycosyltransferase involved in cell wall biosynthesis